MAKAPRLFARQSRNTWGAGLFAGASLVALSVTLAGSAPPPKKTPSKVAPAATFEGVVVPAVSKYCAPCHGAEPVAGANLLKSKTSAAAMTQRAVWEKVLENVRSGHMPPKGLPGPSAAERAKIVATLESMLGGDCRLAEPGRVTLRRLNREEYDNSIRDLLGVDLRIAHATFPSDDVGYGFDNNGDVLSLSPLLMEKYLDAAEKISAAAISLPIKREQVVPLSELTQEGGVNGDGEQTFYSEGTVFAKLPITRPGYYKLRLAMRGQMAGPDLPRMRIEVGDTVQEVELTTTKAKEYEFPFKIASSEVLKPAAIRFLNDFYDTKLPPDKRDRNAYLSRVVLLGQQGSDSEKPASHRLVIPQDPVPGQEVATARRQLAAFARRAWRRPVRPDEAERLNRVIEVGQKAKLGFEETMRLGVQAVLVSPNFLFRAEADPNPGAPRDLTGYELATRLSYFLWSSTPDATLMDLAGKGLLTQPETLKTQVVRMLKDPKAKALADSFAAQWLQLRKLDTVQPETAQFPFDEALRAAMGKESKLFFQDVVRNDRPVTAFIDGAFTYVNRPLAKLYGIPGDFTDADFVKVPLPPSGPRAGLLTQASVLTVTSNPTRTSPVKRGKWVLEALLGTPPPPPPPGVGDIRDGNKAITAATFRKRLEEHRKNPTCASCHQRMDPLGFSLENFDAIGRYRTEEAGTKIDTSGTLPNGREFRGPIELRKILREQSGQVVKALSEKMLTYATGRGMDADDRCHVDSVAAATRKQGDRFSALVTAVVLSDPFRKRDKSPLPSRAASPPAKTRPNVKTTSS